jgi:hypothetical protein
MAGRKRGSVQPASQVGVAGNTLGLALHGRGLFALAFLGGLLVKLPPADFGQDAGFFAGTFEAPEGGVKIFVFSNANAGQRAVPRHQKKPA